MESTNEKTSKNDSVSRNKLLEELLSNIPKDSKLELIDFGPPVGRELPEFSKRDKNQAHNLIRIFTPG